MKKSVENFFNWWLSLHPGNVSISEKWLNLGKSEEEWNQKRDAVHLLFSAAVMSHFKQGFIKEAGGFQNVSLI